MSDLNFHDVVISSKTTHDEDWYPAHKACCTTCGTYHKAVYDDFPKEAIFSPDRKELKYVAEMRAWNCCHEGETPHDGFPKEPDRWFNFGGL